MRGLRIIVVVLVALLAWLQYRLWAGEGSEREVAALRAQVERQAHDNAGLRQRNDALAAAVEERARSELGMIKPGETFYRVVEAPQPSPAPPQPANDGDGEAAP